ncbi:hypothetical protein ABT009_39420 [Streptomyces sp. NPDC002896]|uniref:hypothetical protein n=1 Tax=Streptomyces sp. NPDC002896 TaxID=3154438 RepID=UPI00332EC617
MRRWVKVSVAAAVVLGVGGWIAQPYVQDWALARNACGGALPGDAVEQLAPDDSHLKDEESGRYEELGSYWCSLGIEGSEVHDERLLEMQAYTRRDDQDREFMSVFPEEGFSAQAPLPAGLPGFIDRYNAIQLLLDCPDLGKDAEGRQRKLLVRTWMGRDVKVGVPGAAYRTAVALANSASDKFGCGAEPLKEPDGDAVPVDSEDDPKTVPLSEAAGTPCGWLTKAGLPESTAWRVAVGMNDAAPTGHCDVSTTDAEDPAEQDTQLVFVAWYGDWSNRLTAEDGNGERLSLTATAHCDGEAANFALSANDDIPGVGTAAKQRLLKDFAQDQVRRRGCSGLRFSF